jgi:uncharacterized protein YjdB
MATVTATTEDGLFSACCVVTVQAAVIPVTGVSLGKTTATISVNGTEVLSHTVAPSNATNRNVRWNSNNVSVVIVDSNGKITGVSAGTAIVTVTTEDGQYSAGCVVTVQATVIPVTGISLGKTATTLAVNGTETLSHTVAPSNATNRNVRWNSNDATVVTVDGNGKITGIAAGTAAVTVTTEDGQYSAGCIVTVQAAAIPVTGVSLGKTATGIAVNGTEELTHTVAPSNATNKKVRWSSSNSAVVIVDSNGKITGVAAGTAIVTVTTDDGQYSAGCAVTVQQGQTQTIPVTGISLGKTTTTIPVNGTEALTYTVAPANATNKNVTWSSSNASIVAVDGNGRITGVAVGTATVTATTDEGQYSASCMVTVQQGQTQTVPVTGLTLNKSSLALFVADVEALTAIVTPANATNKKVTWTSSNSSVATVDATGAVRGIASGTATVTATSEDGGYTAACTVTVTSDTGGNVTSTGWAAPAAGNYEHSMTYVAQVAFRGVLSTDTNVEVAAYVNNELRGYAKLVYESGLNAYLVHLTIYSNSAGGETITLKAYNPQKQRIYNDCKTFRFQGNTSLGSASEILNCFP